MKTSAYSPFEVGTKDRVVGFFVIGALLLFLQRFEIASFDHDAAHHYGPLRQVLQAAGQPIGPLDMLIAAHALSAECILVTHNVREFSRIPDLTLEDWIAAD